MAIQLPYTRQGDTMMEITNRVAQRRFAMQERHDQQMRYEDSKAQAERALAWDKEKFGLIQDDNRAERAQQGMILKAQQRAADLEYRKQEMAIEQQKIAETSAGYMGKLLAPLSLPRAGFDAFGIDQKGQFQYDEARLKARAFSPATKEKWWFNYVNYSNHYGTRPSRAEFEKMWAIAEGEQNKRIYAHVKSFEQLVPREVLAQKLGGPEYAAWSSSINSQIDPKDFTSMLPTGVGEIAQPSDGGSSFFDWGRRAVGVGAGASSAASLFKELHTIPKATKMFQSDLPKAAQWASKASKGGLEAASKLSGVAQSEGIDKIVEGISKLPKPQMEEAIRGLATKMPLGSLRGLAAKLIRVPEPRTRAIGFAILSLGLLGWDAISDVLSDEE